MFQQPTNRHIDRYWGESSPYADLTTENLQLLTLKQAIADFTYFAKTAALPFDKNGSSNADKAPWVFSGGSYSGALAAWTESTSPGMHILETIIPHSVNIQDCQNTFFLSSNTDSEILQALSGHTMLPVRPLKLLATM